MVPRGECTFALLLEYDGRGFRGWQKQPGMVTVQGVLEEALRTLLGGRHSVAGAARTDAGVHAEGQVASFRGPGAPLDALKLPTGVRLLRWARAAHSFHARASAIGKQYRYQLAQVVQDGRALDWARARAALRSLEGLSDLRGLSAPSRNRTPAPPLSKWSLDDTGVLRVEARAFRKHEVRNLAGHLLAVALGLAAPETLRVLAQRARPWMGARAPADWLTLVRVIYPPELDPFRSGNADAR